MPETIRWVLDFLLSTGLTAGAVAGAVVWLSRHWLSEKIKSQIKSEYDHRLESHKAQLKAEYDEKLETHKAQLKANADTQIEKLKSELSVAAARRQALFSNLDERRAEVIAEVYASLKDAVIAIADYTKAFEPAGGPSRDDRRKTAVEAANAFAKLYEHKKVFLPEAAANRVDAFNVELKQAFIQFAYGIDLMSAPDSERSKKWVEITQKVESLSKVAIGELERDFRAILGDEA